MERVSDSGHRGTSVLSVQLSIFSLIFCGEFKVGKHAKRQRRAPRRARKSSRAKAPELLRA